MIDDIGYTFVAAGLSLHDLGLDAGMIVAQAHTAAWILSTQNFSVAADVGGLHATGLHPLERWLARTPGSLSGDRSVRRRGVAWSANYFSAIHRFVRS